MRQQLSARLQERHYRARTVSAERLPDLQQDIDVRHRQGMFDEEFYQERLASLDFRPPDSVSHAKSLIVVAVPDPQIRVLFNWKGERVPFIVPPTYLHWRETDQQVEGLLSDILEPAGYQVAQAALPKKLLAVRSGLAAYGRNNITYVPGMGSFHRLVALYSDLPCPEDDWQEPKMMERCEKCSACLRTCPTGAIASDRFLLRADRCITFLNEKPGEVSFPEWVDPSWHNCLVGCMHCQRVCPENKGFVEWVEGEEEFSPEETSLLLQGGALDQLPEATVARLERLDLIELLDVLPRNLSVLLEPSGSESPTR